MQDIPFMLKNKEIGVEVLWKFLLRLIGTSREERTRGNLAKYLGKSPTTISHITNPLGRLKLIEKKWDPNMTTRTNDYYQLQWGEILELLVDMTSLDEEDKDTLTEFLYPMLEGKSQTLDINTEFQNILSNKTDLGKLLKVIINSSPELLFVSLIGIVLLTDGSNFDSAIKSTNLDEKIILILTNFMGYLLQEIPNRVIIRIFSNIKLGNIKLGNILALSNQDQPEQVVEESDEGQFPFSALLQIFSLLSKDGYMYDGQFEKLLISITSEIDIDVKKPIKIEIPVKKKAEPLVKYVNPLKILELLSSPQEKEKMNKKIPSKR